MSLINEALKEAQRERSERAGARAAAQVADNFFPYPASRKTEGGKLALVASAFVVAALILTAGAVGVRRVRASRYSAPREANAGIPARSVAAAMPPSTAHPISAPPPAITTARLPQGAAAPEADEAIASPAIRRPSVATPPKAPPKQTASATAAKLATVSNSVSVRGALRDTTPRVAPPAVAPVQPQGVAAPAAGVHLVMEPSDSRMGDSLFARAYAEHRRGNLDRAADLYEKAIAAKQSSPELYNDYGALLAARGNYTGAITMYRMGLGRDEQNAKLWANLADAYNATGRHADALAAYDQAAKLDPANATVKMRLASEYQAIGDSASARRDYENAVELAPKDPAVHYAFGAFLQAQHDIRGAVREYQRFVDTAPGQYPQAKIDEIKAYVASLRKYYHE